MDDILEKLTINIDSNYADFKDKTEFYVDMIEDIKNCIYIKTLKTEVYVSSKGEQYKVPALSNLSLNTLSSDNYNYDTSGNKYTTLTDIQTKERDNFINKNFNNIPFLDFGNYIYVTLNDFYRIRSVSKTNSLNHKTFNDLDKTPNSYKTWKKVDLLAVETFSSTTELVHHGVNRLENSDITDQTVITKRSARLSVGSTLTFGTDIYNINNWEGFLTNFLKQRFYKYDENYYIINDLNTASGNSITMALINSFPTVANGDYLSNDYIIHNDKFYLNLSYNNSIINFNTGAHVSESGQTLTLNIDTSDLNTIITTYNNITLYNITTLITKFTNTDEVNEVNEVNLENTDKNVIDVMTYHNNDALDPLQYYFNFSEGTKLYITDIYFYQNLTVSDGGAVNVKFVPTEEELEICYRNYKIDRHTFENSPLLDKNIDYIFKEKTKKDYAFTNYIGSYDNNIKYENTETETETAILNYYDSIYINKTTHDFMDFNDNYITVYKHELSGTSCGPNDTNTKILNPLLPELRKFSVKLWRVDSDGLHVPIEINKNGIEGVIRVVMSFTIYYKRKKVTMV